MELLEVSTLDELGRTPHLDHAKPTAALTEEEAASGWIRGLLPFRAVQRLTMRSRTSDTRDLTASRWWRGSAGSWDVGRTPRSARM